MMRLGVLWIISLLAYNTVIAQERETYSVVQTDNGQYIISGTSLFIDSSSSPCNEMIEEVSLIEGVQYTIVYILDEERYENKGLIIFDKKGNQIDLTAVQTERAKYYDHYKCCLNIQEIKGKLYFWEYHEPGIEAIQYDCSNDSQTDCTGFVIPRYYIFNPKKGSVKTKILVNPCTDLIIDGKISCE